MLAAAVRELPRRVCTTTTTSTAARGFFGAARPLAQLTRAHAAPIQTRLATTGNTGAHWRHTVMATRTLTSRAATSQADKSSEVVELDTATATGAGSSSSSTSEDASDADQRFWWTIAGLSGGLAVALGAFGAHGLKARVTDTYFLDIWNTAAHYHLVHSVALAAAPVVVAAMRRYRARTGQSVWAAFRSNLFGGASRTTAGSSSTASAASRLRPYRNWSARSFVFGTVFFSGSLYALTLTENRKWGAVTPIGGVGFILGWLFLALGL